MDAGEPGLLNRPYRNDKSTFEHEARSVPRKHAISPQFVASGLRGVDLVLLSMALAAVYAMQTARAGSDTGPIVVGGCCASAVISYCLDRAGVYRIERKLARISQAGRLLISVMAGTVVFALCLALLHTLRADAIPLAAWTTTTLILLAGAHVASGHLLDTWRAKGVLQRRVAVIGVNEFSRSFIEQAAADPGQSLRIVGVYTDVNDDALVGSAWCENEATAGTVEDLVIRSRNEPIDAIVLAIPLLDTARLDQLRHSLRSVTAEIYGTPDIIRLRLGIDQLSGLGCTPVVRIARAPLTSWQQFEKSVFDRLVGAILLIILLPALLLIAVAIRLETPGPVLFRQTRIGFNNRSFVIYKFRTMFHHSDHASLSGARQARRNDPRITKVGKWLRKLSLDELPQLLNVLKGEMSLVGPRPHPPGTRAADRLLQDAVADYELRHRVRPGITGWAQVNGWRGETSTLRQIEQRVAHDIYYIENWSLRLDLRIMMLTVVNEIRSKTAF